MSEKRFVVDTNLVVSAVLLPQSTARQALDKARSQGKVLLSRALLEELDTVFRRSKFNKYITEQERLKFLTALAAEAEQVDILDTIQAARDPKDDKILELAVNGKAILIITGDQDLLVLNPFQTIEIITPRAFIDRNLE